MKWILRIAGGFAALILLAVIGLFLAGLRPGAGTFQTSTEIAATPEQIWPWINDGPKLKQWISWLVDVQQVGPNKTVWVMRDENNRGTLMRVEGTVVESVPPLRKSVTTRTPGAFHGGQQYTLTSLGQGRTRFDLDGNYVFDSWFVRLMEPLITPAARKKMTGDLARLKSNVEGTPVTSTAAR